MQAPVVANPGDEPVRCAGVAALLPVVKVRSNQQVGAGEDSVVEHKHRDRFRNLRVEPDNELSGSPRVSPDGRFLARHRADPVRSNPDIWVDDLEAAPRFD
jgi:hypothetical protein